jgi:hypothetical protein
MQELAPDLRLRQIHSPLPIHAKPKGVGNATSVDSADRFAAEKNQPTLAREF